MKERLIYFLFGILMSAIFVIALYPNHPEPKGDLTCGKCGAYEWYFKLAASNEEDSYDRMD